MLMTQRNGDTLCSLKSKDTPVFELLCQPGHVGKVADRDIVGSEEGSIACDSYEPISSEPLANFSQCYDSFI